ncbi:MAG: 2,3-bisphosphoglycerate-dependent phosphoglycerate mutase [Chlamydiales bacterium]|nr:2,3-bisphosphoglycerate-dependent phosphoglycerate mutase [Chlamydiales bacterium]
MKESILILVRHGQSDWNKKNLFTGWVDIPLSNQGIREAIDLGQALKDIPIDVIFSSNLVRAQMTAFLMMSQHSLSKTPVVIHPREKWSKIYSKKTEKEVIPVYIAKELNERMYGELQGKNKEETAEEFGAEQVRIWRRSFDVSPPNGESLKMTYERTIPYFEKVTIPYLVKGNNVLISAHGNSLRSIVKFIEEISDEDILHFEIPTGRALCYVYKDGKFYKESLEHCVSIYH